MNADDDRSIAATNGFTRVVTKPGAGAVTSVQNWNAAASYASGDLLVVIADDLYPPLGWDATLRGIVGPLDTYRDAFVVKVNDSDDDTDMLVRHPIVSRAFYQRFGLFSPQFRGQYCDRDLTTRAYWRSIILDGRTLALDHFRFGGESESMVNQRTERDFGKLTYARAWSLRRRSAELFLLPAPPMRRLSAFDLLWLRNRFHLHSNRRYLVSRCRLVASRLCVRHG